MIRIQSSTHSKHCYIIKGSLKFKGSSENCSWNRDKDLTLYLLLIFPFYNRKFPFSARRDPWRSINQPQSKFGAKNFIYWTRY